MAAAEVRAAWQRTANRCLVQEDAKRAPKLACCPSSTPQSDSSNGNTACAQDYIVPNFCPVNRNLLNANLSPETKWWLQLQPNFGYQKDYVSEQVNTLEDEVDDNMDTVVSNSRIPHEALGNDSSDLLINKGEHFLESPWVTQTDFMNHGSETRIRGSKATDTYSDQPLKRKIATNDYLCKEELDLNKVDRVTSKSSDRPSELDTLWAGGNKPEPWWRTADRDELALLVTQKSMQHIENCDLPKPSQMVHVTSDVIPSPKNFDTTGVLQSSLGRKLNVGIGYTDDCSHNKCTCSSDEKNFSSHKISYMIHDSELYSRTQGHEKDSPPPSNQAPEYDLSRAELLEALRHSQTRARKAEMAAQKAYDEKEHIVKLLFRQASHLFAYKQWLQVLQWQNLFLQLKLKDHEMPAVIPVLPLKPLKGKLFCKDKLSKKGRKKHKCNLCKYAVVFAVGLGLVGAGLLFGWTVGCLFPTLQI